jgi:hypothetical protein
MSADMEQALLLIVVRCPGAAAEAMRLLRAARAGAPSLQGRYSRVVALALSDPASTLTQEDRALLAEQIASAGPVEREGPRTHIVRLRLSEEELERLKDVADGRPLSAYIRSRLLG